MTDAKRSFRTEASYAFEREARDAVAPFLRSRGFQVHRDLRSRVGLGESQQVLARAPWGEELRMRVRLCWRRDGRHPNEALYSAAQLAALTRGGD